RSRARSSEIRLVCLRDRDHDVAQEAEIVLGAVVLLERTNLSAAPALDGGPARVEGARIVDSDRRLERLATVEELEPLHDVDLVGVRCLIIVDERFVIEPDGVDDELVALIMADRLSVPRRLQVFR